MRNSNTLVSLFLSTSVAGFSVPLRHRQLDDSFDWSAITPSRRLEYHECYGAFKCARLKVPLDWTRANNSSCSTAQWAAIGIITLPATVPDTDPSFGGTILVNPGGPGGAGTQMALGVGEYLQSLLDGDRHYEILGFDPRGVALSTPRADCYNSDINRAGDAIQRQGLAPASSGATGLNYQYQVYRGLGDLCAEAGPDSIFNHMSTASVARDMLEIVDRVNELRHNTTDSPVSAGRKQPGLQYLGVSYGTVLGNTFASMFPGRVERMVLDGVADADDFTSGTWAKNLDDAELVIDHFYETCFKAGDLCALKLSSDTSAVDIRGRVDAFIKELSESPISTVSEGRVRLITSLAVREAIRTSLYSPIRDYEPLSATLADTLAGNYTLILQTSEAASHTPPELVCDQIDPSEPQPNYSCPDESGVGVLCGDSATSGERNISWAKGVVEFLKEQSPTTGEPWSRIPLSCSGWKFHPKYAFAGPFGHAGLDASLPDNVPSAPLFIISTRYDHATPLTNAEHLSTLYPGSAVLIQESWGHVALLVSKSACTAKHLRTYFDTGKVPANGTACEEDCASSIPYKECPGFPL